MIAGAALLVTPGPAVLYIVARSLDGGPVAGIVSTLGIAAGSLVHVGFAAFGLSALLMSSAVAFSFVKYLGAAYLIYLGLKKIFSRAPDGSGGTPRTPTSHVRSFYQGFWVNVLNPKTALFFFAFLPQFADPTRGSVAWQIVFLGGLFITMGIVSDGTYALLAGGMGRWLRGHRGVVRRQRFLTGGVYVALGLATALSGVGKEK